MFTDQINIEWMCYNCFILWCVIGSKASLACIWHEEQFYTAGPLLQNGTVGLALGFHAVKLERIYHADLRSFPCV